MKNVALTVTQLNEYVRKTLAADPMLRGICIMGEISNFKSQFSGHWYFTLKDEEAAIACVMFRTAASGVHFRPENGQRVRLFGSVGMYTKTGSYQFYAEFMEPDGMGDLYLRFEALKQKLASEGLFDPSLKKPLPLLPKGVGIITSKTGAVIHDIADVSWRRFPGIPLYLFPVKVQGEGAAEEIASAIQNMDRFSSVDVLIIGRGGGSMEDLWPFNEECVARAIAACEKPIVSAVGHETDFTISDFAADLRAPTPSAAAELVVPQREALRQDLRSSVEDISRAFVRSLQDRRVQIELLRQRLETASPMHKQQQLRLSLHTVTLRLNASVQRALKESRFRVESLSQRVRSAGPMETIARGYALVTDQEGALVRGVSSLAAGDSVHVRLSDGSFTAGVLEVRPETFQKE